MDILTFPTDIIYHILYISDENLLWILSKVNKQIREVVKNVIINMDIVNMQKIINNNIIINKVHNRYDDLALNNKIVCMKFIAYTLVNNRHKNLIFNMKLNNTLFCIRNLIMSTNNHIILHTDEKPLNINIINRRNFDYSIEKLSNYDVMVSRIVKRLGNAC